MTNIRKKTKSDAGYCKPPKSTRFKKGQSGNPRGHPKGRHKEPPNEAVLGQLVTIREDGVEREVTAAEAFLLHMTKRGLEGNGAAGRAAMTAIEEARRLRPGQLGPIDEDHSITIIFTRVEGTNIALEPLRMATKLDRNRDTARMALEPWVVEAALERLGDKRLTPDEQKIVTDATRTPHKVNWPKWWEVRQ